MVVKNQSENGIEEQRIELTVDPDIVIKGIKLDDTVGIDRSIMFHSKVDGSYATGKLEGYQGHRHWDGLKPIIMNPMSFIPSELGTPSEVARISREEARKEDENPDAWAEEGVKIWERDARGALKNEIVSEPLYPHQPRTIYEITYESGE